MFDISNIIYILFGVVMIVYGIKAFNTKKLDLQMFPGLEITGQRVKILGLILVFVGVCFVFISLIFEI